MSLYKHQEQAVEFLVKRPSAALFHEMGCGKSRVALFAAQKLFEQKKIDRVLILAPASVLYSWREELAKLGAEGFNHNLLSYNPKKQQLYTERVDGNLNHDRRHLPIAVVSYALIQQERHTKAIIDSYVYHNKCALICDESSFLKSRTAKQTKNTYEIARHCAFRWLLSGTPVCNSPLDLYAQGKVMTPNGEGPLRGYKNFYHFRAAYGTMGGFKMHEWFPDEKRLPELTKRFAPYVSRVEKKDCLDLPPKSYSVREVQLSAETWRIYQELKRECMLCLPDSEAKPEPNAAVRILRLCQITSGHVGLEPQHDEAPISNQKDVSSEKIDYLAEAILTGELANELALIIWCRWRRERERLWGILGEYPSIGSYQIFGGQSQKVREEELTRFMNVTSQRVILLAQQHSGGFGLNLTAASTAVYLSNDFSYSTRVQSEDRCHRIGQHNPVTYIDVVAVGPKGQRTVDHAVLEALRAKQSIAEWTTSAWRKALEEE